MATSNRYSAIIEKTEKTEKRNNNESDEEDDMLFSEAQDSEVQDIAESGDQHNKTEKGIWSKVEKKKGEKRQLECSPEQHQRNEKKKHTGGDHQQQSNHTTSSPSRSPNGSISEPGQQEQSRQSHQSQQQQQSQQQYQQQQQQHRNPEHLNILFINGTHQNLGRYAYTHAIKFNREMVEQFGQFKSIKIKDSQLIVTCNSQQQKERFKQESRIMGIDIQVTDPSTTTMSRPRTEGKGEETEKPERMNKAIIFGVPIEISEEEIADETGAIRARRMTSFRSGQKENTENVILFFLEDIPAAVHIGFLRYKTKLYIPHPYRCNNCQRFGHNADVCYRQACCPRCSGGHTFSECNKKDEVNGEDRIKCANCHGPHSAAWTGCPKYREVQEALKLTVECKMSYRDAVSQVKKKAEDEMKAAADTVFTKETYRTHQTAPTATSDPDNTAENNTKYSLSYQQTLNTNKENQEKSHKEIKDKERDIYTKKLEKKIEKQETQIANLEKKVAESQIDKNKITDLLKFCILGIFLSIEKWSGSSIDAALYKQTVTQYAAVYGIDTSQLNAPLPDDNPQLETGPVAN